MKRIDLKSFILKNKTMQESYPENYFMIALLEISGIGIASAKKLIERYGSAQKVLGQSLETYKLLGDNGRNIIEALEKELIFSIAKEQIEYAEKYNIEILSFYDNNYPRRLKHCADAPLILYYKGNTDLNNTKVVGIVGTRNATAYGKKMCDHIVEELATQDVLIVSGLAYGIDVAAHNFAMQYNTPTIGVLAHGLDSMYPKEHSVYAKKMLKNGGLLTENKIRTRPNRENFPKRNRVVAGMCDAIIVVESAITGGSMITAKLGNDYNRDVFAVPGRLGDKYSEGCNHLIKINQAHLLQASKDIAYILNWNTDKKKPKAIQKQLFVDLTTDESAIITILQNKEVLSIDELAVALEFPMSKLSTQLLLLEFKGMVRQLPGKKYELG